MIEIQHATNSSGTIRPTSARLRRRYPVSRLRGEGTAARRVWRTDYLRRLIALDLLSAAAAGALGYLARFSPLVAEPDSPQAPAAWFAVLLPVVWIGAMAVSRTYEQRFLWVGPEEFRRVFRAAVLLLAGAATVSWALKLELARGFTITALPLAALFTLVARYAHRLWLHRQRSQGRFLQTTLIVGHRSAVAALHEQIEREAYHGYKVVGYCLPPVRAGVDQVAFDGLPVLGDMDEVADVVRRYEVDTVAVLPCPELDGPALRQLGWQLESTEAELLLAPAVTELVGTRVQIRPVSGLPLLHMERPEFTGLRRATKGLFDRGAALFGILLVLPVLVAIALAVKTTSAGPVFFRHERVGRDGQPFHVLKFRSMAQGADRAVDDLMAQNEGNEVQFKMRRDPRVTRVGAVLRRYSLDELPQLFNVLGGSMSLVGPRPHVTREVALYGDAMRRRLLVKPGITGLWQVSGRSDLSWDDSVRIDVRYVENWSLGYDFMILAKTFGAVLRGSGAY